MKKFITLGKLEIPIQEFAAQGNAAVGIRASGKTYSMTGVAEQLLDAGIPFVAFDPIGVWRNLKVPGAGKGYRVVVAHPTTGDLPLTPESAPEIVRAAMRENIPLVIDLYAMTLSKADWKRIVESCVNVLLYENKPHGLRHIFIEEAAEFCPQMVSGDNAKVYAAIEKLARMGGNSSLGYTLINQRSEQLNKAVLELCECLFLFRQKGKNSLAALGKWLDYASPELSKEIIKTMPSLPTGDCWAWMQGATDPVHIHMPRKNSFHPDRQNPVTAKAVSSSADVSSFVSTLSVSLEKHVQTAKENDPAQMRKRIAELEKQLKYHKPVVETKEVSILTDADRKLISDAGKACESIYKLQNGWVDDICKIQSGLSAMLERTAIRKLPTVQEVQRIYRETPPRRIAPSSNSDSAIGKCERAILTVLAQYEQGRNSNQIAIISGYSVNSGGFNNSLSKLRQAGFITTSQPVEITENGRKALGDFTPLPTGVDLLEHWMQKLGRCEAAILNQLAHGPMDRASLAQATGYSENSGGFNNSLSKLRTLELISRGNPISISEELI